MPLGFNLCTEINAKHVLLLPTRKEGKTFRWRKEGENTNVRLHKEHHQQWKIIRGGAMGYEFIIASESETNDNASNKHESTQNTTKPAADEKSVEIDSSASTSASSSVSPTSINKLSEQKEKRKEKSNSETKSKSKGDRHKYPLSICSIQGKRAYMEDEYYTNTDGSFVAVMDGHGGSAVSRYIRQNLYARYLQAKTACMNDVESKIMNDDNDNDNDSNAVYPQISASESEQESNLGMSDDPDGKVDVIDTSISKLTRVLSEVDYSPEDELGNASLSRTTKKMLNKKLLSDAGNSGAAILPVPSMSSSASIGTNTPTLHMRIKALTSAFEKIDSEVQKISHWSFQGSTAVAVLLCKVQDGENCIRNVVISANVGDSRAVLCRAGKAIDLTRDHKPNDPIEKARIESLGGKVNWFGPKDKEGKPILKNKDGCRRTLTGVYRINRNLALSRAIGDRSERPLVSSQVEIEHVELDKERDEFIILASDGLWDVWESQEVIYFCRRVLHKFRDTEDGKAVERVKRKLSKLLVREALKRGSMDNITAVIVWLRL